MRHIKSFTIEQGQNQEDLCDQINAYANNNNLSVFNITFSHFRSAFVIFEHDVQVCEALSELSIKALKDLVGTINIPLSNIKVQNSNDIVGVEVSVGHDGAAYTGCGYSTPEATSNLIINIEKDTGCRVLVNCGSNGKQDASFFMRMHDKLVADQSKH